MLWLFGDPVSSDSLVPSNTVTHTLPSGSAKLYQTPYPPIFPKGAEQTVRWNNSIMGLNSKFRSKSLQICLQPKYLLKIIFLHSDLESRKGGKYKTHLLLLPDFYSCYNLHLREELAKCSNWPVFTEFKGQGLITENYLHISRPRFHSYNSWRYE